MARIFIQFTLVLSLSLLALPATQGQGVTKAHGITLRVQSIQRLVENTLFLFESMGKKEEGRQIETVLKLMTGPKGLEGINTEKPMGLYGNIGANIFDSDLVTLIPIADQATFVALLERLNLKPIKGDGGMHTLEIPNFPFPLFFRFQDGYLLLTVRTEEGIKAGKVQAPAEFFKQGKGSVFSFQLNLEALPEDLAKNIIPQLELQITQNKNSKVPGESPAQERFRKDLAEFFLQSVVQIFTQGELLSLDLDLDSKAGDIGLALAFKGKKGSALAKGIEAMGKQPSLAGSLKGKNSVVHLGLTTKLPDNLKNDLLANFLETIQGEMAKEKDAAKKALLQKFLEATKPTLETGVIDFGFDVRKEASGKFSFAFGLKVEKGKAIEDALRLVAKSLPPSEQQKLEWDNTEIKGLKTIKALVPTPQKGEAVFGKGPVYFSIQDNKILVTGGDNAVKTLEEVAFKSPQPGKALEASFSFNEGAPFLAGEFSKAEELAQKIFSKSPKADTWDLQATGGNEITLKMNLKSPVLHYIRAVQESKK